MHSVFLCAAETDGTELRLLSRTDDNRASIDAWRNLVIWASRWTRTPVRVSYLQCSCLVTAFSSTTSLQLLPHCYKFYAAVEADSQQCRGC